MPSMKHRRVKETSPFVLALLLKHYFSVLEKVKSLNSGGLSPDIE